MKGVCDSCKEIQKIYGMEDYCCVLCVFSMSGISPAAISKDENGTVVVDLSKVWKS